MEIDLCEAVRVGDLALVKKLAEQLGGVPKTYVGNISWNSPLYLAAEHGHLHIVEWLIPELGTENHTIYAGALSVAVAKCYYDIVNFLIHIQDYLCTGNFGNIYVSCIQTSVEKRMYDITKLLVDHALMGEPHETVIKSLDYVLVSVCGIDRSHWLALADERRRVRSAFKKSGTNII